MSKQSALFAEKGDVMDNQTTKRFSEAMRELLAEHELSQRELSRRTRKHGWGSQGYLSFVMNDQQSPTPEGMEAIAKALKIRPEYFAEYRLARARESLDPAAVGLKVALRNLAKFEK